MVVEGLKVRAGEIIADRWFNIVIVLCGST